ncbi:hypothetical protein [Rhodococcus sp. 06-1460-1B]|uniref:hypothetical protein n=1 Tax=Rhodococcus sp. 06-1460-1B TaxID=2022501 RepID=UPI000B9ABB93|nr:hypothetical protein [Rhodococcus sp. 06-1460-1B]OZD55961.1 hypothetical protein CH268_23170 [Rhodococcus sp. 06-1460-1B]
MEWQAFECVEEWRLLFVPDSGHGAPTRIVDACGGYYPFIQWPIQEKRLLLPVVCDGTAVWRDPRTDLTVAEIGLLTDRPRDPQRTGVIR